MKRVSIVDLKSECHKAGVWMNWDGVLMCFQTDQKGHCCEGRNPRVWLKDKLVEGKNLYIKEYKKMAK